MMLNDAHAHDAHAEIVFQHEQAYISGHDFVLDCVTGKVALA